MRHAFSSLILCTATMTLVIRASVAQQMAGHPHAPPPTDQAPMAPATLWPASPARSWRR